jgi:DNA-3-methyladenine glycosylase
LLRVQFDEQRLDRANPFSTGRSHHWVQSLAGIVKRILLRFYNSKVFTRNLMYSPFEPVPLSASWFARPATDVAPDSIGCALVRELPDGQILRGRIVETEAYTPGDPACHAYRRKTNRNAVMFGPPGHAYVYLIYGMYHCLNLVTDLDGVPSAVLIRALELDTWPPGSDRAKPTKLHRIAAGPGKLCQAMQIDQRLNAHLLTPASGLWMEPRPPEFQHQLDSGMLHLTQTTRIGLTQGVDLPWRWYLSSSKAVSKFSPQSQPRSQPVSEAHPNRDG